MSVNLDFSKFAKESEAKAEKIIRGSAHELFSAIITDTPVKDGYLRGNWQTSLGAPKTGALDRTDKSDTKAKAESSQVLSGLSIKSGDIYLSNNLEYAEAIENGNATHRPQGMVKRNIDEFNKAIERNIK